MKNKAKKYILSAVLVATIPCYGVCSSAVTTRILQVGTYGNGNLAISFEKSIDEAGCSMAYFELPANSPAFKVVFATATLAFATNANVEVKADGCFMGVPSLSGGRTGYFIIKQ